MCDNSEYQEKQHEKIKGRSRQSAKRNAQKKRAGNACIVCGRDKNANRFYSHLDRTERPEHKLSVSISVVQALS